MKKPCHWFTAFVNNFCPFVFPTQTKSKVNRKSVKQKSIIKPYSKSYDINVNIQCVPHIKTKKSLNRSRNPNSSM